jgi:hypothetical protein
VGAGRYDYQSLYFDRSDPCGQHYNAKLQSARDAQPHAYQDANRDSHQEPDAKCDTNTDAHANGYSYSAPYCDPDGHAEPVADSDAEPRTNPLAKRPD